jgi:hypothetical protein
VSGSTHFEVRFLDLEAAQVENRTFEMEPSHEQAAKVCGLLDEFMRTQPREFRQRLPFLTRGDWELEWSAAEGGVAFVVIHESGEPATLGVMVSGQDPAASEGILEGFRHSILGPALDRFVPEDRDRIFSGAGPLVVMTAMPGRPELLPTLHLLNTSLAAVFFRRLQA